MQEGNDWEELELDQEEEPAATAFSHDEASEEGARKWIPWALLGLIPIGLLALWWTLSRSSTPIAEAPAPEPSMASGPANPPPPPPEVETEPEVDLPALSQSDDLIREMSAALTDHLYLQSLLAAEDLIRKLVVIVANVAEGVSPAKQLLHVRPEEGFAAIETRGGIVLDPEGYRRFDAPAQFFASLDPRLVARLHRLFDPLLEEAHAEIGLSDRDFDETLALAIRVLLATPVHEGPIRLRAVSVNYAFEDPRLEQLALAQKHLVRMGPENTRRIQKKLEELARALSLTLPPAES